MCFAETVGGVCDVLGEKSSNVITSSLERRAGKMYRQTAERFACCAMTRSTVAKDRSGATIVV